jgi:hypothetical protein
MQFVVWQKRKVLLRMAHGDRGTNSRGNPEPYSVWKVARLTWAALVLEWYYCPPEMSSNNYSND